MRLFGDVIQRAKHWQLVTEPYPFLDDAVDEVGPGLDNRSGGAGQADRQ